MPYTPISPGVPFSSVLSFSDGDNTDTRPLVESKNVRGGMVLPANNLATTYPGTDQQTIDSIVPFQSLGFEGTGSSDYILKVAVAGGSADNNNSTQWEPLADYLGGVGGKFMLAQADDLTQTLGAQDDSTAPHLVADPSVIRLGLGPNYTANNVKDNGLIASIGNEVEGDAINDTIRFGLTNATNLNTVLTASEFASSITNISANTDVNVMAWSPNLDGGSLIPSPIQVRSTGTGFVTTIRGNLDVEGTIDYGSEVQANTLSVADKFITLNDNYTVEHASIEAMTSAASVGGILVQIGTVDDNSDGDVTDLGEVKYKAFYWDAGTGNWSFADAEDIDEDSDGNADGYSFSNVNILASKTNIVDLHFGDTVTTPSTNLEWTSKFVTPQLLSSYLQYSLNEATVDNNNAVIPDVDDAGDNVYLLGDDTTTYVRYSRIWYKRGTITSDHISGKKMYVLVPRSENDDIYSKPPVVKVYRSTQHTAETADANVKEEVMCNVKIRSISSDFDRIELYFATWPGDADDGLAAGDAIEVRVLH